ncbi:NuA4 complex subunit EAF3 like [Pseudolycoriella hygida]|uniref:NuA4 complex subunit EAF3 like n=1 Tax=Pseudolycoriella hygida TaxID=35572 RepID=A0A9Q0NGQ0_9DIPT|nr:NuA4 complex subunit EAF3 like [Pseudolycoriella hygida]
MFRRITRSQTICLAKPVPTETKKVQPPKKHGKKETTQSTSKPEANKIPKKSLVSEKSGLTLDTPKVGPLNGRQIPHVPLRRSARLTLKLPPPSPVIRERRNTMPVSVAKRSITLSASKYPNFDLKKTSCPFPKLPVNSNESKTIPTDIDVGNERVTRKSLRLRGLSVTKIPEKSSESDICMEKEANPKVPRRLSTHLNESTAAPIVALTPNLTKCVKRTAKPRRYTFHSGTTVSQIETSSPIHSGIINDKQKKRSTRIRVADIFFSEELKKELLKDLRDITIEKKLYEIPQKLNVADVVEKYVTTLSHRQNVIVGPNGISTDQIFTCLIEYFDLLIGRQLLYESEKEQFAWLLRDFPEESMAKIYPPIYLLRLLVQLNKLFPYSTLNAETKNFLFNELNEFTMFLSENVNVFFS